MASWKGRSRVGEILARLPPAMKAAAQAQLDTEAEHLAQAIARAAPVGGDLERAPGELAASVHVADARRRELLKTVTADARDAKGNCYAPHVEFGHLGRDGRHVPAVPFFFTTWRREKGGIHRRMSAAGRKAAKAVAGDLAEG